MPQTANPASNSVNPASNSANPASNREVGAECPRAGCGGHVCISLGGSTARIGKAERKVGMATGGRENGNYVKRGRVKRLSGNETRWRMEYRKQII